MSETDFNRYIHQAHTKLLGGKRKAARLRREAADLREQHGLCLCSDEEKIFASHAEADADKSPAVICHDCGKQKLRVIVVRTGIRTGDCHPPNEHHQRLVITDLLKRRA